MELFFFHILRKNIIALVLSYRVNRYNTIFILSKRKEEQKEKSLSLIRLPKNCDTNVKKCEFYPRLYFDGSCIMQ